MELDSYVTLGRSGLRVSPFTLGTMGFGETTWGADRDVAHQVVTAYLERGGNSVDTANVYALGRSEEILGEYLAARPGLRERIVLGTKFFWNLHPGDPNAGGAGRRAVQQQIDASLRRLRTDHVDLYWLHNFDPDTPIEETLRALDDLVTAGKIRYLGWSDTPAWATAQAATIARFRGWTPITALQVEYSLLERTSEGELLPMAEAMGMGALAWSPLKSGLLSGRYSSAKADAPRRSARTTPPEPGQYPVIDALNEVAAETRTRAATVALAWLCGRRGLTGTVLGVNSVDQLNRNLAALELHLNDDQRARLDGVSRPVLNFPAANNAALARMARNGGTEIDGAQGALADFFPTERSPRGALR